MDGVPIPCWYSKPGSDKKTKALLLDTYNGYATIALESGKLIVDHIEYVTLDSPKDAFAVFTWGDEEG